MDVLAPVIVFAIAMLVPIVLIMSKHQQKMAMLMRSNPQMTGIDAAESAALRRDMAELKTLMHQQAIAMDDLTNKVTESTELNRRLERVAN